MTAGVYEEIRYFVSRWLGNESTQRSDSPFQHYGDRCLGNEGIIHYGSRLIGKEAIQFFDSRGIRYKESWVVAAIGLGKVNPALLRLVVW